MRYQSLAHRTLSQSKFLGSLSQRILQIPAQRSPGVTASSVIEALFARFELSLLCDQSFTLCCGCFLEDGTRFVYWSSSVAVLASMRSSSACRYLSVSSVSF